MINNPILIENGADPILQEKSITPSESVQNVTPDSGYDGLSKVTVEAIQTETKTVTSNGTVTPSAGKYLKQVTVNVPTSGIDTSDATATASDIAKNKTAYINGGKVNGALPDYLSDEGATFPANYTQVSDYNDSMFLCRGSNSGDKILRDGAYANVYVRKNVFGNATAADVAEGKTFTSTAGLKVTGTHVCSGGLDTSDATATVDDVEEGKTFYSNSGVKETGTLQVRSNTAMVISSNNISFNGEYLEVVYTFPNKRIYKKDGYVTSKITGSNLGNATAEDVAEGKTFTSASGLKVTGTHVCSGGIDTSDATATAEDMAEGVTAYVNGEKVTGNVKVFDTGSITILPEDNVSFTTFQTVKYIQLKTAKRTNNALYRSGTTQAWMAQASFFGDATAADVAEGKTFTSSAGLKVTGTHVCSGGLDTSDATATAEDIVKDKTAYVNGEKVTGTVSEIGSSSRSILATSNMVLETVNSKKYIKFGDITRFADMLFRKASELYVRVEASSFGNATAEDVLEGKTFTSTEGIKVTGTAKPSVPTLQAKTATPSTAEQTITPDSGYDGLSSVTVEAMPSGSLSTPTISSSGLITAQVGTSGYLASGTSVTKQLTTQAAKTVTPTTSEQTVVNSGVYTTGAVKVAAVPSETKTITANGTYTPSSGKFFSSVTVNVPSSSGGGSSDNNCEAYHITSASAKLNFKTSGTVKVWGYGTATSGYMTSMYAFVGDGYYKSAAWGGPTKTSASFGIKADGTLSGLPNMSACDLLVTVGV